VVVNTNRVKERILSGGISIGTFIFEFCTTGIGRLAANAGAEFAIFDMEHTGWSMETIKMLMASSRSVDLVPLVRIPATEYHFAARALDMGAMGIMIPMCESAEQAKKLVASSKYPPVGKRGAAFVVAHDDYQPGNIVEKISSANQQTLMIAQIETVDGLKNVDAIATVEGIDVLWIGQTDLSTSLGIPGQFDHPLFKDAVKKVVDSCNRHGKVAGFMPLSIAEGKQFMDQGFRMLAYGGDLWLYLATLKQGIGELRNHREGIK
jgi:2-keto-3-deoxy-L-rhamnonate aldolase RhmA